MNNIKCQIPNHQEQFITLVCLNTDCKDNRLCCYFCIEDIHKCHIEKTIKIQQINDLIQKQSAKQVNFTQFHDQLEKRIVNWNQYIEGMLKYVVAQNSLLIQQQNNSGQLSEKVGKNIQFIRKQEQSQAKQLQFSMWPIEQIGHQSDVNQVVISQDGLLIVSGSRDNTVKLWDVKTKTLLQTIENDSEVYHVAISSKNQYLAFGDYNSSIKLFDLMFNKVLWIQKEHKNIISCIMFSQDTQYLLSGGDDKKLIIWSVINNTKIHCFETDSQIQSIVISRNNKLVSCTCRESGTIYIWDFKTKTKLIQEKNAHSQGWGLCISSDSSLLISSGLDGRIKIWKLNKSQNNQKLIRSIKANKYSTINLIFMKPQISFQIDGIEKVILTPDELYIISICNEECQITIHKRETVELIQVLNPGYYSVNDGYLSISNDMSTLVSSNGRDNRFRIWTRNEK